MKPLSELEKYFRERQEKAKGVPGDDAICFVVEVCWKGAADSLQAWLREADVALDRAERNKGVVLLAWVRIKLLGTMRPEGEK